MLSGLDGPGIHIGEFGGDLAQQRSRAVVENAFGFLVEWDWSIGPKKTRTVDDIEQRLGALFQARHGRKPLLSDRWRHLGRDFGAVGEMRQQPIDRFQQFGVAGLADVMSVEIFKFGKIKSRRRAADLRQIESRDHFLGGEYFLIAMAPAEAHQVIAQCGWQVTHRAIGIDAERAMALRQFGPVWAVDQRYMRHDRYRPAE